MGYFVTTTDCNFFLPKENLDAAYKAMCDLNQRDDKKHGGRFTKDGLSYDSPRPAGLNYHPARWFSWMHPDYPSKCKSAMEVLQALGFDADLDEGGNIVSLSYDNKTGSEELFLEAIAPFVKDGSYICWRGEDGYEYRWLFQGGKMIEQSIVRKEWA